MTERLFLEDPNRAHCLAEVAQVRGRAVVLTRSVLYGESKAYGHPQPPDRGHLLAEGRKIKVGRCTEREGLLLHHLEGDPPARGARVQVHLDLPRRLQASRGHTLAHLLADVAPGLGLRLLAPPRVVGGGVVRAAVAGPAPGLVARLQAEVAADRRLAWRWVPPEQAPPAAPWPAPRAEASLRVVEIEGLGARPCDGTHARRTAELGAVRVRGRPRAGGGTELELVAEGK